MDSETLIMSPDLEDTQEELDYATASCMRLRASLDTALRDLDAARDVLLGVHGVLVLGPYATEDQRQHALDTITGFFAGLRSHRKVS